MSAPRPGDYFVVATDGPVAGFIRAFERHAATQADRPGAWANHTGIYGDGCLIEAQPHGVRSVPLDTYDGHHLAWSSRPLSDSQRLEILGAAEALIGIPYSFLDIAALAFSTLGAVPDWVWARLNRGDRLICSQLVAHVYRVAGDPLTKGDDCRVTPAHVATLLTGGLR